VLGYPRRRGHIALVALGKDCRPAKVAGTRGKQPLEAGDRGDEVPRGGGPLGRGEAPPGGGPRGGGR